MIVTTDYSMLWEEQEGEAKYWTNFVIKKLNNKIEEGET